MVRRSYSTTVIRSSDFSDYLKTTTNNWPSVSKTSMLILPNKGMSDVARRLVSRIKRMNSLPLERSMSSSMKNTAS